MTMFERWQEDRKWEEWKSLNAQIDIYRKGIQDQHMMSMRAKIGGPRLYYLNPNFTMQDCRDADAREEQHTRDMAHIARENIEKMTKTIKELIAKRDSVLKP